MDGHYHTMKYIADAAATTTAVATVMGWLPNIAAVFSIVWLAIQISDWSVTSDSILAGFLRKITGRKKP